MDVAIAIRTGIIKDQTLYVQAAAGVVADSVPEMARRFPTPSFRRTSPGPTWLNSRLALSAPS
jgi:hypothetical protein